VALFNLRRELDLDNHAALLELWPATDACEALEAESGGRRVEHADQPASATARHQMIPRPRKKNPKLPMTPV
jgi:hypothetical protein